MNNKRDKHLMFQLQYKTLKNIALINYNFQYDDWQLSKVIESRLSIKMKIF